ncbi:uncharacterized protein LOC106518272 [Austrofundulus limnaeus]|uniref:Uncharacterized protein LOC106518272 n=1 Tax=Austrofundulus limnaeus TaxID=52670 RepID=A0A2I4BB07_AUSLI|nr:PREDICTED: uncharacterized protein LOC106518272 [Austrofundulus limnaeus]
MVLTYFDLVFTGEKVKKRWKNLRDTFIRARKALKTKKSGSAAGDQKIWKYFHIMSFLEPYIKKRDTSGNLTADDPQREEEEQEEEMITLTLEPVTEGEDGVDADLQHTTSSETTSDSSSLDLSTQQTPQSSSQKTNPVKRRRPDQTSFEESILSRVDNIRAQIQRTAEDEDELYLQCLLPILRRLMGARKSEAKMEIMRVLHKFEFGEG